MSDIHSTGRGGAGNIGKDDMPYTDAGIVHEGASDNPGSAGRGGAGNIAQSPRVKPASGKNSPRVTAADRLDDEVVPEPSLRTDKPPNFHTGRGGAGNEHRDKYGGHSTAAEQKDAEGREAGLKEKVKHALHMDK